LRRKPERDDTASAALVVAVHARVMRLLAQRGLLNSDAQDVLAEEAGAL
jgi:hypothetical protein